MERWYKRKHFREENVSLCAFIGFGQMILASSSWRPTCSSFYANHPLYCVFIGEQRGGVVWKAWHHANAALWNKCAPPEQPEHQWTFYFVAPDAKRAARCRLSLGSLTGGGALLRSHVVLFLLSCNRSSELLHFFFQSECTLADCMNKQWTSGALWRDRSAV